MFTSFKRVRVYAKLALAAALIVWLLLVVLLNRGNKTDVWFVWQFHQVPTLWLMVVTALISIVSFWLVLRLRGVLREYRQMQSEAEQARRTTEQQAMADRLAAQERRIDEKLRGAIGREESPPK